MTQGKPNAGATGFWLGLAAMTLVVTGSNVAVQYPNNDWLTWGALTYTAALLLLVPFRMPMPATRPHDAEGAGN